MKTDWVVYTKACFNQAGTVVNYLARYSRKTALNNSRLQQTDTHQIQLRYKDYRDNNHNKVMLLDGCELIRRFLLHILPKGFMRIRHYGFLANRSRQKKLAQIRKILSEQQPDNIDQAVLLRQQENSVFVAENASQTHAVCPQCKKGQMLIIREILPKRIGYG